LNVFKSEFKAEFEGMEVRDDLYLITSPEYALKKYLVAGFEKIFQVTKSFRNKEVLVIDIIRSYDFGMV
jgi:elongation factor P--beta-lysine ligase